MCFWSVDELTTTSHECGPVAGRRSLALIQRCLPSAPRARPNHSKRGRRSFTHQSSWPGHSSVSITTDIYGHLVGTVASDAVNGLANLIARTSLALETAGTDASWKSAKFCGQSAISRSFSGHIVGLARFELATP
jgi:hypothetical protein